MRPFGGKRREEILLKKWLNRRKKNSFTLNRKINPVLHMRTHLPPMCSHIYSIHVEAVR